MDQPVPKDKQWLSKYFKTDVKTAFLKYMLTFGSAFHFMEHTGFRCDLRYVKRMKRLFFLLEDRHEKARSNLDFEAVADLEMGNFRIKGHI